MTFLHIAGGLGPFVPKTQRHPIVILCFIWRRESPHGMPVFSDDELGPGVPAVSAVGTRLESNKADSIGGSWANPKSSMWLGWQFQIEAYVGDSGCLETLQVGEVETNSVIMISLTTDTLKVQARSRQTYVMLATATSDVAVHIVGSIADPDSKNGEDSACGTSQQLEKMSALLNKVMKPHLRGGEFIDQLQIWENDTAKYSAATKEVLGDRILISVLMTTLNPSLRAQVQLILGATPTWARVRSSLVEYHVCKRHWDPVRHRLAHNDPMEIDATDKGKGKEVQRRGQRRLW